MYKSDLLDQFMHKVQNHTLPDTDIYYKVNALVGELGEYSNVLKKEHFAKVFDNYKIRIDKEVQERMRRPVEEQKIDELGDILFYLIQIIIHEGYDINEIMRFQEEKLDKQGERFNKTFLK